MFKRFFKWIKDFRNKIYQRKIEEFRKYYGVTYVDEEMHKDPKLERYYMNKYPMPHKSNFGMIKNLIIICFIICLCTFIITL